QLHMRFSAHKTTVGAYIRTRRLERIRADLANPLHKGDSIATISARYGLHDPSQVSRAFKAEFRESPSAFRTRVLRPEIGEKHMPQQFTYKALAMRVRFGVRAHDGIT